MGKKLEKNALAKLTLAESCQIDLGDTVTSIDSTNYKTDITWSIKHSNAIANNAEFMGQNVTITDATEGTTSNTTYTIDYSKIKSEDLIFQSFADGKKINTLTTTEGGTITNTEARAKIKNVYIPYGITSLSAYLLGYVGAEKIEIPDSLITIGAGMFRNTVFNSITFPANVKNIGIQCFNLSAVNSVDMSATGITNMIAVFQNAQNLKNVNLPNVLTTIGANCFRGCSSLTEINIPATVTSISADAFSSCTNLATITINNVEGAIAGADTAWGCPNVNVQIIYTKE